MNLSDALKELAEPRVAGDPLKAALGRVMKLTGLGYSRCFELWYGRAKRIEQTELDAITDALQAKRERDDKNELQDIKRRLAAVEARLNRLDARHYRPVIDDLGAMVRGAN